MCVCSYAYITIGLMFQKASTTMKLDERRVDENNPFDTFAYWFEYDAGRLSQLAVVVLAVACVVGLVMWVFR